MAHVLSPCPVLAQTKYLARHDAVLKVLFFDIIEDLGLIEASPLWYSPTKPQPGYEGAHAQAYWDFPVYAEYQDLRANRIDAKIVNHQEKKVIVMEMSRHWVSNRQKKTSKKTMKYAPLTRRAGERSEAEQSASTNMAFVTVWFLKKPGTELTPVENCLRAVLELVRRRQNSNVLKVHSFPVILILNMPWFLRCSLSKRQ